MVVTACFTSTCVGLAFKHCMIEWMRLFVVVLSHSLLVLRYLAGYIVLFHFKWIRKNNLTTVECHIVSDVLVCHRNFHKILECFLTVLFGRDLTCLLKHSASEPIEVIAHACLSEDVIGVVVKLVW